MKIDTNFIHIEEIQYVSGECNKEEVSPTIRAITKDAGDCLAAMITENITFDGCQ